LNPNQSENENVDRGRGQRRLRALAHYKGKTHAERHETPKAGVRSSEEKLPCSCPGKWGKTKTKTGSGTKIRTRVC